MTTEREQSHRARRALAWAAVSDLRQREAVLRQLFALRRSHRPRLTQAQVAERMRISQATVSAFEARRAVPRLSTLQRYARAIGVRLVVSLERVSPEEEFAAELAEATLFDDCELTLLPPPELERITGGAAPPEPRAG